MLKRQANVNIRNYLFDMFRQDKVKTEAWCPIHNRDCRLWSSSPSPRHGDDGESDSESDKDGEPPLSFHGAGVSFARTLATKALWLAMLASR